MSVLKVLTGSLRVLWREVKNQDSGPPFSDTEDGLNRRTAEIRQRFGIASPEHSADFFCSKFSASGRISRWKAQRSCGTGSRADRRQWMSGSEHERGKAV